MPKGFRNGLSRRFKFVAAYLRDPQVIGAVAPSSRSLAKALCVPYESASRPATVLEVGAGTGPVTRELGRILRPEDRLDICEISGDLADILERDVLGNTNFAEPIAEGRVRLLRSAVQDIQSDRQYDFVISGLPFTSFELSVVQDVFGVIRRLLKPDGVFSYFEYAGIRRTSRMLALGRQRSRVRSVSAYMAKNIRAHQFAQRLVLSNLPPARARHLRFHGQPG